MTTGEAASATATMLMKMNREERLLVANMLTDASLRDGRLHAGVRNVAIASARRQAPKKSSPMSSPDAIMDQLRSAL